MCIRDRFWYNSKIKTYLLWLQLHCCVSSLYKQSCNLQRRGCRKTLSRKCHGGRNRLSTWLKENEKKEHDLSPDEERQWQAETKCHICKDKFYSKPPATKNNLKHLKEMKQMLIVNKLDVNKIPSIKMVKKQKRIVSLQLHPDKQGDASNEEKLAKQELSLIHI